MGRDARNNIRSFQRPTLPPIVHDALGRILTVGDLIILQPSALPMHMGYRITAISPEIHPSAPNNLVRVTLYAQFVLHGQAGGQCPVLLIDLAPEPPQAGEPPAEDNGKGTIEIVEG